MARLVVSYRGWKLWRKIVTETGEYLFVQVLQVHIDRRLLSWHDCVDERGLT